MNNEAQELVDQMVAAEGWPKPELLEAILEQGEEAVDPLLEVLRGDRYEEDIVWASVDHTAQLLASLEATSTIPAVVEQFYRYDTDILEGVSDGLGMFGPAAIEPALEVVADESLRWYPRVRASSAAIGAAGDDPQLRDHVAAELRKLLREYMERDAKLGSETRDMASWLVYQLSRMADPQARELIHTAFEENAVEEGIIDQEFVASLYRKGGEVDQPDPETWIEDYGHSYERHLAEVRRYEARQRTSTSDEATTTSTATEHPDLGRNDPCWCGSGKKYKHCHLRKDQGYE